MMTGIPVKRMVQAESDKLRRMAEEMRGQVVGQDEAIQKVVKAIQRNRVGLKDPKSLSVHLYSSVLQVLVKLKWHVPWHATCSIRKMHWFE